MLNRNNPKQIDRGENPFPAVPTPLPCLEDDLRAVDIFTDGLVHERIRVNAEWLQYSPRSSSQIDAALFPYYSLRGMDPDEVRILLNRALWDAGYEPSDTGQNPVWSWTEGN